MRNLPGKGIFYIKSFSLFTFEPVNTRVPDFRDIVPEDLMLGQNHRTTLLIRYHGQEAVV